MTTDSVQDSFKENTVTTALPYLKKYGISAVQHTYESETFETSLQLLLKALNGNLRLKFGKILANNLKNGKLASVLLKSALKNCPYETPVNDFMVDIYCFCLVCSITSKTPGETKSIANLLFDADVQLGLKCFTLLNIFEWFLINFDLYKKVVSFDQFCGITNVLLELDQKSEFDFTDWIYHHVGIDDKLYDGSKICFVKVAFQTQILSSTILSTKLLSATNTIKIQNTLSFLQKSLDEKIYLEILTKILVTNKYENPCFQKVVELSYDSSVDVSITVQKALVHLSQTPTIENLKNLKVYSDLIRGFGLKTAVQRGLRTSIDSFGHDNLDHELFKEYILVFVEISMNLNVNMSGSFVNLSKIYLDRPSYLTLIFQALRSQKLECTDLIRIIEANYHKQHRYSMNFIYLILTGNLERYRKQPQFGTLAMDKRVARERGDHAVLEFINQVINMSEKEYFEKPEAIHETMADKSKRVTLALEKGFGVKKRINEPDVSSFVQKSVPINTTNRLKAEPVEQSNDDDDDDDDEEETSSYEDPVGDILIDQGNEQGEIFEQKNLSSVGDYLAPEDYLKKKIEVVMFVNTWLSKVGLGFLPDSDALDQAAKLDCFNFFKSGTLLCKMLNNILQENPNFTKENLPTIEINEKNDLFAELSNLVSFVRTCELYFKMDRTTIFDPVAVLQHQDENSFINGLWNLKLATEQLGVSVPYQGFKPYTTLTFEQLSTLVTMLTANPTNPTVGYDPRVVLSVQDVEVFQKVNTRLEQVEKRSKNLMMLSLNVSEKLETFQKTQVEMQKKLEKMSEGVLSSFEKLMTRLDHMKNLSIGDTSTHLSNLDVEPRKKSASNAGLVDSKVPLNSGNLSHRSNQGLSPGRMNSSQNLNAKPTFAAGIQNSTKQAQQIVSTNNNISLEVPNTSLSTPTNSRPASGISGVSTATTLQANQAIPKVFKLPQEILSMNLPKDEMFRQSVIYEFIESEADYVRDLNVMLEFHYKEIKNKKILQEKDLKTLFGNIEEILPINQKLLQLIVQRRDEKPVIECVGDLILQIVGSLNIYDSYCANYPQANILYKELRTREDFKLYLEKAALNSDFRGLSLESFLIKPVQRICKYPLFIKEMLKRTPLDHKDKALLDQALQKIEEVVNAINERTRIVGDREKLLELQSKIESNPPLELIQNGRRAIRDGILQRISNSKIKDRYFVLLNDYLLLCKLSVMHKAKYQFEHAFEVGKLNIVPVLGQKAISSLASNAQKYFKTMFEITCEGQEPIYVNCPTEADRLKWIQVLEEAIKEADKKIPAGLYFNASAKPSNNNQGSSSRSNSISGTSLKKSNTLSVKKRTGLWGSKKKGSSVENLADDDNDDQSEGATDGVEMVRRLSLFQKVTGTISAGTNNRDSMFASPVSPSSEGSRSRRQSNANTNPLPALTSPESSLVNSERSSLVAYSPSAGQAAAEERATSSLKEEKPAVEQVKQIEVIVEVSNKIPSVEQNTAVNVAESSEGPKTCDVEGFPDWRSVDAGNNTVYYYNTQTNETSWYHPAVLRQAQEFYQRLDFTTITAEDAQKIYLEKLDYLQNVFLQHHTAK